jgi:hypothetical protein
MSLSYKNNRRSWFSWVKKDRIMNNNEATFWLSQFIGKNLRIHASDGRVFGGQMKCTDRVSIRESLVGKLYPLVTDGYSWREQTLTCLRTAMSS